MSAYKRRERAALGGLSARQYRRYNRERKGALPKTRYYISRIIERTWRLLQERILKHQEQDGAGVKWVNRKEWRWRDTAIRMAQEDDVIRKALFGV